MDLYEDTLSSNSNSCSRHGNENRNGNENAKEKGSDSVMQAAARPRTTKRLISFLLSAFDKLPARGKPQKDREWTVLAGVFVRFQSAQCHRLVSIATGTKCVGLDKMADDGGVLNDCHAEVLARRGLKLFLMQEAALARDGGGGGVTGSSSSCIFQSVARIQNEPGARVTGSGSSSSSSSSSLSSGGGGGGGAPASESEPESEYVQQELALRPGVEFTLVVTETPCGEASNYHQQAEANKGNERVAVFRETGAKPVPSNSTSSEIPAATSAAVADAIETRAALDGSPSAGAERRPRPCPRDHDVICPSPGHHRELRRSSTPPPRGPLRTKSARSDTLETRRTVSMSCSDKLALWNCVGFQGALLSRVVSQPMRFSTLVLAIAGTATTAAAASGATARAWAEAAEKATAYALSRGSEAPPRVLVDAEISFRYGRAVVQERLQKRDEGQVSAASAATRKAAGGVVRDITTTAAAAVVGGSSSTGGGTAQSDKPKKKKRCPRASPCGTSIVWVHAAGVPIQSTVAAGRSTGNGGGVPGGVEQEEEEEEATCRTDPTTCGSCEVLVAVHGLKQGSRKRRRQEPTNAKTRSMLCKAALFSTFCRSFLPAMGNNGRSSSSEATALLTLTRTSTYHEAKKAAAAYRLAKARLLSPAGPFHGWLQGDPGLESFPPQ